MKKNLSLCIVLLLNTSLLMAQETPVEEVVEAPVEVANLSADKVEPGEYEVVGSNTLSLNGQDFTQYTLQKKYPLSLDYSCTRQEINLNRGLLAANVAGTMLAGYGVYKISSDNDKARHFLAGYVVGNITTGSLQLMLPKDMKNRKLWSIVGGIGASVLVGLGKEYYDSKGHGHVDAMDAVATGLGGIGGTVTIGFGDMKKVFSKKPKKLL
jgi:fluoride ion exporter CrcB/FEX